MAYDDNYKSVETPARSQGDDQHGFVYETRNRRDDSQSVKRKERKTQEWIILELHDKILAKEDRTNEVGGKPQESKSMIFL